MPGRSRSLRRLIRVGVPLIGVAAILASAFLATDPSSRAALGLTGAILTLLSSFALQERLLPNERQLVALRAEVDAFIVAVRRTNSTALATAQSRGELADIADGAGLRRGVQCPRCIPEACSSTG